MKELTFDSLKFHRIRYYEIITLIGLVVAAFVLSEFYGYIHLPSLFWGMAIGMCISTFFSLLYIKVKSEKKDEVVE